MSALTSHIRDSERTPPVVSEVLSDDAYKRGVELAFYERMVRLTFMVSRASLRAAREQRGDALTADVQAHLQAHRSPMFARLARAMEKEQPPSPDFGQFRSRDR
ncbi:hypothetical protein [Ramlibacter alkalitolerans]|uniref:Uncharacterized protein n=1 Tax=Ramlibacter alkalitolerans TaxID=2039631 RepID=A0ABS1JU71_9BURK|nr:hypothetical protein [Ramlibacter alkalitolerans]MBL0427767.1 hypothetical protein [Ramlibacter alkalitolerans]